VEAVSSAPLGVAAQAILQGVPEAPSGVQPSQHLASELPRESLDSEPSARDDTNEYQSKDAHMPDGQQEFRITITGNGLAVERSIDQQTAWAILARLFAPEAATADARMTVGSIR
jgi:hypothetical protein